MPLPLWICDCRSAQLMHSAAVLLCGTNRHGACAQPQQRHGPIAVYRARRMRMYMLSRADRAGGGGGTPLATHARRWVIVPCDGSTPALPCDRAGAMRQWLAQLRRPLPKPRQRNAHYSQSATYRSHSRQVVRPVGLAGSGHRCRVLGFGLQPAAGGGCVAKGRLRAADAAARRRVAAEHRPHRVECDAGNAMQSAAAPSADGCCMPLQRTAWDAAQRSL